MRLRRLRPASRGPDAKATRVKIQETAVGTDRVLTVPNVLSLLRIVAIGVFVWLVLGPAAYGWAFVVLALAGVSDYLDGYVARRWHQISAVGQILDPFADRLTAIAVPVVLAVAGIVPWWLVVALVARDVLLLLTVPLLLRRGRIALPVHYIGKAATFTLLFGLPLILLGTASGWIGTVARVLGWALTLWGVLLYWWSAAIYLVEVKALASTEHQ
jgi:cardiolipin synthase (CMP-forming)